MKRGFLFIAICLGSVPLSVFGQINYVSASRTISATVSPITPPQVSNATDTSNSLGAFNQSIDLLGTANEPDGGTADSNQSITSSLDPTSITISGTYSGDITAFAGTSHVTGHLSADIEFTVTSNTPYSLTASTSGIATDPFEPVYDNYVALLGPSVSDNWLMYPASGHDNYSDGGILAPGQYSLATSFQSGRNPFGYADDVENPIIILIVPEPGSLLAASLPLFALRRRSIVRR